MGTPYEDALANIAGGGGEAPAQDGYSTALSSIASGDYSSLTPSTDQPPAEDDWWKKYWGHLSDQASLAYHAASNGEDNTMPTTDPMTLTQLIANRAPYQDEIDAASDPNADADTKERAAIAAQRLARIDSVLSQMHGQGPAEPLTQARADDVVRGLTHNQLMASDRYRQVYDSTSTDMMDEGQRRDYARDTIAKEVSDLPYQRESILAQISGQDPERALEMYGINVANRQDADAAVPQPSALDNFLHEKVDPGRIIGGLGRAAASTEELAAKALSYLSPVTANNPELDAALAEFHKAFVTDQDPGEAKNFGEALADAPGQALKIVAPALLAGPAGEALSITTAAAGAETLAPSVAETAWNAIANRVATALPGAVSASIPMAQDRYDAAIEQGATPAQAAQIVAEHAPADIAMNLMPVAAGGSAGAKVLTGAGSQAALSAATEYAETGQVDPGHTAIAALTGAALGGTHGEGHVQSPGDVAAAREGFDSAAQVKNLTAAHAQWEGRFAKVLDQIGDDPEAKARADYALSQFNEGAKSGLWTMSELRHIAEHGVTRDEEAYAAAQAARSPEAATMGVTPESAAQERASEAQAGEEVFGEPGAEVPSEPTELTEADLTDAERAAFANQQRGSIEQPQSVNASGESAASAEAISRVRQEQESGQHRALIERDGSVRPLIGVDAVDTHARPGQVIVQRGVGRDEWTVLSHGSDVTPDLAGGKVNAAKPQLDELVAERAREREASIAETPPVAGVGESASVPENETARARVGNEAVGEIQPSGGVAPVDLDSAAHAAETSPLTEGQPSAAKITAGNYKKGHIKALGLDVSIENPRGSTRSGIGPDGRSWSRTMNHHYGYIRGTIGADGGHLDVLLGDQPNNNARHVYVVDQLKPDGTFDEHKVLMGFRNQREAEKAYLSEYPKGWNGMGRVRAMTGPEFKTWTKGGGRDEAATGPIGDEVPRITLRHQQPDAETVHASAPTEGSSVTASANGADGAPLSRLELPNASMPSRRRVVLDEVPRGGAIPDGHGSAVLRNIYDLGRDPRNLMAKARAEVDKRGLPLDEDHVINEFERQVAANGFDGYRSEGKIAVLGHDVPVAKPEGESETAKSVPVPEAESHAAQPEAVRGAEDEGAGAAGRESEGSQRDQGAEPARAAAEGADQREGAPAKKVKPPKYSGPGMSKSAARGLVKLLRWNNAKIEVHQTEADLPQHLRDNINERGYTGHVHGIYDPVTGKVHIVADKMATPKELYRTLTEEHLSHGGLRKVFNEKDLNRFLDSAWKNVPKEDRGRLAIDYGPRGRPLNLSLPENRRLVAEEYLAKLDPAGVRNKTLGEKFHDWFNETSRKMGREVDYSPSELRAIMAMAHDHQRAGLSPSNGSRSPVDNVTPRYNLDGTSKVSDRTFYSALVRSIEGAKGAPKSASAKAWKEWLDGAQRRGEFKKAEREWMGIDQWLDAPRHGDLFPDKNIRREDVMQFARDHQLEISETMLREPSVTDRMLEDAEDELSYARDYAEDESEVDYRREELARMEEQRERDNKTSTKYDQYTLPGGAEYRELLLQIPERRPELQATDTSGWTVQTIQEYGPDSAIDGMGMQREVRIKDENGHTIEHRTRTSSSDEQLIRNARDRYDSSADLVKRRELNFKSGHWVQPNIVAHVRMKQRYGQFGTKTLHLEEIQSDWHQAGREKGYRNEKRPSGDEARKHFGISVEAWSQIPEEKRQEVIDAFGDRIAEDNNAGKVPDAPFKREWPMLAFKRALRYAAENGFSHISWTHGFQQSERYNLARVVSAIGVRHSPAEYHDEDGTQPASWHVSLNMRNGGSNYLNVDETGRIVPENELWPGEMLSDVVGEELAAKILAVRTNDRFDGGALAIGGEGMKAFYDKMLPNEVGKYVKQWGGKVTQRRVTSVGDHNTERDTDEDPWQSEDFAGYSEGDGPFAAHSVEITPAMRESVLAGQPMFRVKRAKADADTEASMAKTMARPPEDMTLGDHVRRWLGDLKGRSIREGWESFKQGMLDSGNQVARIEREVFGGFLGDASESPYKMYNLARNSHAVMASVMKLGVPEYRDGAFQPVDGRKGIFEVFRPLFEHESGESLLPLWEFYAAGKRASRLINETNVNGTLREKNFDQEDIDRALALEEKYPVFKKVADDFEKFNGQLLDLAVDRGALSAEEAAAWKEHFYVPFYRAMEDIEFGSQSKVKKNRRGSAASNQKIYSRRLTGEDKRVDNVFENILANTSYVLDRTYRQEFMNRLLDMGEGVVLERVPMANKAVNVTAGDLARALSQLGISAGYATHGKFGSPHIQPSKNWTTVEVDNLPASAKAQWTKIFQRVAPSDPDVVPIMREGKLSYYRVSDPLLLRTIGAMGHDSFGRVIGLLSGGKRLVTWGVTKDPGFMVATWFRDSLINWVGSHTPITPFVDNAKGALDSVRNDPLVGKLMMAGVGVAPHYETQGSTVRDQMERRFGKTTIVGTLKDALAFWNSVGFAAEASSRLAIAREALRRGGSMAEAAYQAQDILNYSMRGDYTAARVLAATAPFWNAGMQGLYRFLRGAGIANVKAGDASQLRSYMLRGSVLMAATLANAWRNQNDPRYNRLTNDDKDRYWHIFIGDQHFKLPKPFEAGVIFGTMPERIVQRLLGNDTTKDSMRAALTAITEEMRLNPFPQYVRQGIEQWSNRDTSSGYPIVPASMQDQLPQDQFSPYTHLSARAIANTVPEKLPWLNSPKRVESLVRGITGTLGTYALDAADWLTRASGLAPAAPSQRLQDVPVIKRFYGGSSETGDRSQYEDKLYDLRQTADETFQSFSEAAKRGDTGRVQELVTRPAFQYRGALDEMARSVSVLRGVEKQIMQNPFIGPEEKRQQLDDANAARIKLLDQYAPLLDQLHDQF